MSIYKDALNVSSTGIQDKGHLIYHHLIYHHLIYHHLTSCISVRRAYDCIPSSYIPSSYLYTKTKLSILWRCLLDDVTVFQILLNNVLANNNGRGKENARERESKGGQLLRLFACKQKIKKRPKHPSIDATLIINENEIAYTETAVYGCLNGLQKFFFTIRLWKSDFFLSHMIVFVGVDLSG